MAGPDERAPGGAQPLALTTPPCGTGPARRVATPERGPPVQRGGPAEHAQRPPASVP
jgi:hypothetical protein